MWTIRRFAPLAAVCGSIIAIDATLLLTGAHQQTGARREQLEALQSAIDGRLGDLRRLQSEADESRATLYLVVDALNEVVNLARRADTLGAAHQRWAEVIEGMPKAREAATALPDLTDGIVSASEGGRGEIALLRGLAGGGETLRYLSALDRAFSVMADIQVTYRELNERLTQGFELYEEIYAVTDDFLSKQRTGFFRSPKEAADFYVVRTDRFLLPIRDFRDELESLTRRIEEAAASAEAAFSAAEEAGAGIRR